VARFEAGDLVHPFDRGLVAGVPTEESLGNSLPAGECLPAGEWPELHARLIDVCDALGLPVPPVVRAKRAGSGCLFGQAGGVVVVAEELAGLAPDELTAVLAHQCGHLLLGRGWTEQSELSADRAAAAYLGDADAITRAIFRFAGADAPTMLAVRIREIQAWTATPGFVRLTMRHKLTGRPEVTHPLGGTVPA
jgi:Zn-dependent protease with chaperone function